MPSLRRARRSSAMRTVACALIAALLVALVPLDARAAIPSPATAPNRVSPAAFGETSDIAATVSRSGRKVLLGATKVLLFPSILAKSAFGELLAHTGTDPQPYAFTGEPHDPNIGWQYHRARWMDPSTGRFAGMDPFGGKAFDPPSLHRYLYASNDPIGHADPTGEFTISVQAVTTGIISTLSAGATNALLTAVFNGVAGERTTAADLRNAFLIGAVTAPVGGLIARAFAPLLRASLEPFLVAVGSMRRVTLIGTTSAWERFLVKFSRVFLNTNVRYPPVTATPLGQTLKRLVPWIEWQQHHVFVQQAWSRVGSQQQLYSNVLANEGLRRIGNGLWNLIPIPASTNNWLGRSPIATQMIATIYYAVMAFGPAQAASQAMELGDGQ